jgi:hypothetical protein
MKKAIYQLTREHYEGLTTLGKMTRPDGSHYCYVLEDVVRAYGIKDKKMTAIPATEGDDLYYLRVLPSGRYGTAVTVFTDMQGDVPVLNYGGVSFTYIRCHGGNKHEHSEGCLLVNKNCDVDNMTAWGSMLEAFRDEINQLTADGYDCRLRITNKPQTG